MADLQYVIFDVGGQPYGVSAAQVQSIERMLPCTAVPRTVPFIRGVINLRGSIIPIIDLRTRFGLDAKVDDEECRILVLQTDGTTVGMMVDAVADVQLFDEASIEAPPRLVGGVEAEYLQGVVQAGHQVLVLLNLERILSDAEGQQLREVEKSLHG